MRRTINLTAVALVAATAFLCAGLRSNGEEADSRSRIKLNQAALEHVRGLIDRGMVVNDKKGSWRGHRPSAADENEFVRRHDFGEYGKWYLGIDESRGENAKARYKFPIGDFRNVHRCALLAAQSRARQYGYKGIEAAATQLLQRIER